MWLKECFEKIEYLQSAILIYSIYLIESCFVVDAFDLNMSVTDKKRPKALLLYFLYAHERL